MLPADLFLINDQDYTTFSCSLENRFVESRSPIDRPGRRWPLRVGYRQWQLGDQASIHFAKKLPWTLVEIRISAVIDKDHYRVIVTRFDGCQQCISGVSIGDEFDSRGACFFAVWGPDECREEGEGSQKIYAEGTHRRFENLLSNAVPADEKTRH